MALLGLFGGKKSKDKSKHNVHTKRVKNKKKEIKKEIKKQRKHPHKIAKHIKHRHKEHVSRWFKTGVTGFDNLLETGIPIGSRVLLFGGPGSGKTIFGLQMVYDACLRGKKCLYLSFEEEVDTLKRHMKDFGWTTEGFEKTGFLKIIKHEPYELSKSVEAMLASSKGELLSKIDIKLFPKGFKPDVVVVDSLSALGAAFSGREDNYRLYMDELFEFLGKSGSTSFLITETDRVISDSGNKVLVEEFLADGVFVFYHIVKGNVRERACEVIKLRGARHLEKVVPMKITSKGIVVYPEDELF